MIGNLYDPAVVADYVARLGAITPDTPAQWGRMNATQMLAHCNVAYEMVYGEGGHRPPNVAVRLLLRQVAYLERSAGHGAQWFEGHVSESFGPLTATEWNNLLGKHLEHHLTQFGV